MCIYIHTLACLVFLMVLIIAVFSHHKNRPDLDQTFQSTFSFYAANLNPMSHTVHCVTSMAAPSWSCTGLDNEEVEAVDGGIEASRRRTRGEGGLSFLLKQEDTESQDNYICLYNRLDVAVREMKLYVAQIEV